jgi:hypothetical protein
LGSPAPQIGSQAGLKAISDRCEAYCKKVAPSLQDIVSKVGTNLRTVAAELEIRGIKTATGLDVWHPAQVGKLLRRVQYA